MQTQNPRASRTQKPRAKRNSQVELPAIPDKLYFTIGEAGTLCHLKPHVLRYWEQEFPALSPTKRRGNRRYYQREEVLLVRRIRALLYEQGYTIEGAKQCLSGKLNTATTTEEDINSTALNEVLLELEQIAFELERS